MRGSSAQTLASTWGSRLGLVDCECVLVRLVAFDLGARTTRHRTRRANRERWPRAAARGFRKLGQWNKPEAKGPAPAVVRMACCGPQTHDYTASLFRMPNGDSKTGKVTCGDEALAQYFSACKLYHTDADAGLIVMIQHRLPVFKAGRQFGDIGMLPLTRLLRAGALNHLRVVDLSYSQVTFTGVIALAEALKVNTSVQEILMHNMRVGPLGAEALGSVLGKNNRSVTYVQMRACGLGELGGRHIARHVLENDGACVTHLDLSVNQLGNGAIQEIQRALRARAHRRKTDDTITPISVDMEGNLVLEEILNSLTHGVGIFIAFAASIELLNRASLYGLREILSVAVFSAALLLLYTSSTLYHAFFCCKATNKIFKALDHSAIYLLIAGTYTPVISLALRSNPYAAPLLWFQWICCALGLAMEFLEFSGKVQLTLLMYLVMGWSVLICIGDLHAELGDAGMAWLMAGGVFYTGGVPFFVWQFHMAHVVWHMFVLAGSLCHMWLVYEHVIPLDQGNSRGQGIKVWMFLLIIRSCLSFRGKGLDSFCSDASFVFLVLRCFGTATPKAARGKISKSAFLNSQIIEEEIFNAPLLQSTLSQCAEIIKLVR